VSNDKTGMRWATGAEVLHARCAARDLYAVSVSDRSGIEPAYPDGVSVHDRDADDSNELEG
jgi:hypothetical protein